jgi:hypothetical protein
MIDMAFTLLRNPEKHSFLCCFNDTGMFCCHSGTIFARQPLAGRLGGFGTVWTNSNFTYRPVVFRILHGDCQFRLHKRRLLRGVDDYLKCPGPRIEIRALYQTITPLFRKKLERF